MDVRAIPVTQMLVFDAVIGFLGYHLFRSTLLHRAVRWAMLGVSLLQVGSHVTMTLLPEARCNPEAGPAWCNYAAMSFGAAHVSTFTYLTLQRLSCPHAAGVVVGSIMYASHVVALPWQRVF